MQGIDTLKEKKSILERFLGKYVAACEGPQELVKAYTYALDAQGKRLRPIIALLFGEPTESLLHAALSLELFHTCSLIADDLPCMDDELERRNKPALHIAFPESTALLTSYGMLCAAFEEITIAGNAFEGDDKEIRALRATQIAAQLSGLSGATGGQFLDLHSKERTQEALEDLFYKKTVTLFELSFAFGHIFSGGELEKLDRIRKMAYSFGMAFQIADDIDDMHDNDPMNAVTILGKEKAFRWFEEHMSYYKKETQSMQLASPGFTALVHFVEARCLLRSV